VQEGFEPLVLGYRDGRDAVGTVDGAISGTLQDPDADQIDELALLGGQVGLNYDFGELGVSLSGRVYVDVQRDGVYNNSDMLLPAVTIYLLDSSV
jgi:hypothetical protein